MGRGWLRKRKREAYYRRAKEEGYRSRAAYKLKQLQRRFRVMRPGDVVVDLGAAPGGWSQVARELVGSRGRVLAVDRVPLQEVEGVELLRGDARAKATLDALAREVPEGVNCVLSDMAPRVSGNRSLDHARSVELAEAALAAAERVLRPGGSLVAKVFQGDLDAELRRKMAARFASTRTFTPPASPAGSREAYLVAKGFQGPARKL